MTAYAHCIPEFEPTNLAIHRAGAWALNTPVSIHPKQIKFEIHMPYSEGENWVGWFCVYVLGETISIAYINKNAYQLRVHLPLTDTKSNYKLILNLP